MDVEEDDSYIVSVPNCILAFAGRILLKQTPLRFQAGQR